MSRSATTSDDCPSAERLAAVASGAIDAAVTTHAEVCAGCRGILVELCRGLGDTLVEDSPGIRAAPLAPGATIERFVIERRLGAGAMGVVYAAHDPKLSRSVALKVVRPGRSADELRPRFEREAAAAAQVTHPNVVAVYDVGQHGDQIYIAMELVRGDTLRAWLAVPRPWRDVISKLTDAARGIAAIHAAGLVHRDFKPDNVLIGEDGRARVTDFGLARPPAGPSTIDSPSPITTTLTQTGAFVGTPAYAAPEQLRGDDVDAQSDQFAFAVTAWEALYGKRPFHAETLDALIAQMGRAIAAPRSGVPTAVERVLRRAMSVCAADRYPTMIDLAAALERACRRRWWPSALAGGAVMFGGILAAVAFWPSPEAEADPCLQRGAALTGVWDPHVRASVTAQFARSGHPGAASHAAVVSRLLDQFAVNWTNAARAICGAQREGLTTPDVAVSRTTCLGDHLTDLRAIVRELQVADATVVERAPVAVERLADPARCQVDREVRPAVAPALVELRGELAQIEVMLELRGPTAARAALDPLRRRAATLGDVAFEAELGFAAGVIAFAAGQPTIAIDELRATIVLAERARLDHVRVRASVALANALVDQRQLDEAERVLEQAQATHDRLGGDAGLEVQIGVALARVHHNRGQSARALAVIERIAAAAARRPHQHSELLMLRSDVLRALGRGAEAAAALAQAVTVFDSIYGKTAGSMSRLTNEAQQALLIADFHRVVQVGERALLAAAPNDPETVVLRRILYGAHVMLGQPARARDDARANLALALAVGDKSIAAMSHSDIGIMSLELDDHQDALAAFRASVAIATELGPDGKELLLDARLGLGRALAAADQFEEAIPELERVLPALERAEPPRASGVAHAQASLASALWRRNRPNDRDRARVAVATAIEQMRVHRKTFRDDDPLGRAFQHQTDRMLARYVAWQTAHR